MVFFEVVRNHYWFSVSDSSIHEDQYVFQVFHKSPFRAFCIEALNQYRLILFVR